MRVFLSILVLSLCFVSCGSKKSSCCPYQSQIKNEVAPLELKHKTLLSVKNIRTPKKLVITNLFENPIANEVSTFSYGVVSTAFNYKGVRYRRGGLSEQGLDCSGLIYKCFSNLGISLPRRSIDMANAVDEIPRQKAQKGDLIFFKTSRRNRINHVGLVVETNGHEIKFIHASIKNGVIVSSTNEAYYARAYAKVGRVAGA